MSCDSCFYSTPGYHMPMISILSHPRFPHQLHGFSAIKNPIPVETLQVSVPYLPCHHNIFTHSGRFCGIAVIPIPMQTSNVLQCSVKYQSKERVDACRLSLSHELTGVPYHTHVTSHDTLHSNRFQ